MSVRFVVNDGGRKLAGFKGSTDDCVTRAITIATGLPYQEVYDLINVHATRERGVQRKRGGRSSARTGVHKGTTARVIAALGWEWVPTMRIGQGCRVHLRAEELPPGRLIVSVSRHLVAVVDGVIHDTHDPSRHGTRCVYGYWTAPRRAAEPRCPVCGGVTILDASARVSYTVVVNTGTAQLWRTCDLRACTRCEWAEVARLTGAIPTLGGAR